MMLELTLAGVKAKTMLGPVEVEGDPPVFARDGPGAGAPERLVSDSLSDMAAVASPERRLTIVTYYSDCAEEACGILVFMVVETERIRL